MELGTGHMTTTVYDRATKVVACDSRWSIPGAFGVLYVDDAPFQKIEVTDDSVFIFAGMAPVIDQWKKHLRARKAGQLTPQPPLAGIAVLAAEIGSGSVVAHWGQDIVYPDPNNPDIFLAGTGSTHAARCWQTNKCPHKAVATAMSNDLYSGGTVRFFELETKQNNLIQCDGIEILNDAFLTRGMVMFNQEKGPVTFREAAQLHPDVANLYKQAANGALSEQVQAPCDAVFNKPTAEDEKRFSDALQKIFG